MSRTNWTGSGTLVHVHEASVYEESNHYMGHQFTKKVTTTWGIPFSTWHGTIAALLAVPQHKDALWARRHGFGRGNGRKVNGSRTDGTEQEKGKHRERKRDEGGSKRSSFYFCQQWMKASKPEWKQTAKQARN